MSFSAARTLKNFGRNLLSQTIPSLTLVGWIATQPAWADESDVFNANIFATAIHDNNLFRLPEGTYPPPSIPGSAVRDETVHVEGIRASLDKTYSLQQFHLNANLTDYRFQNFSYLDYQTKNFDAAWNWSLTPNLTGKFSKSRTQSLNEFDDYRNFSKNIKTIENRTTSVTYGISGQWQLFGGTSHSNVSNDIYITTTGDPATRSAEAGIRYAAANGDSLALLSRTSHVDWLSGSLDPISQADIGAVQHDLELRVYWQATGKSVLQTTITQVARTHENFPSRNYSGTAGSLSYTWLPGSKIEIPLAMSRNYASWWELSSSYVVVDSLTLTPVWQPTAKTAIKLRLDRSRHNFSGPIWPFPEPLRQDVNRSTQLTLNWTPWRSLSLSTSLHRDRRFSNQQNYDYRDTMAAFNAQFSF